MDFSHVHPCSLVEEERMVNSFVIMVGQSRFPCSGPVSFVGKTQGRQLRREILDLKKKKKKLFLKNLWENEPRTVYFPNSSCGFPVRKTHGLSS